MFSVFFCLSACGTNILFEKVIVRGEESNKKKNQLKFYFIFLDVNIFSNVRAQILRLFQIEKNVREKPQQQRKDAALSMMTEECYNIFLLLFVFYYVISTH